MTKSIIFAGCIVALTGLTACGGGWQLKGYEESKALANAAPRTIFVKGISLNSDFGEALRDALANANSRVVEDASMADMQVTLKYREERVVSGFSATRSVREFDHQLELKYSVSQKERAQPIEDTIFRSQTQTYDSEYVLGTQEESDTIKRDLRRQVAQDLVNRLARL